MVDQAESLRQLAMLAGSSRTAQCKPGRVIVVLGSQPGVGTTTVSVNLSIAFTRRDSAVTLVDADFQQPAVHQQCGLTPRATLRNLVGVGRRTVREIQQVGPAGLNVLPGCLLEEQQQASSVVAQIVEQLPALTDWVLIDSGCGLSFDDFNRVADDIVVVTTSSPESVMEAYAAVKQTASKRTSARFWLLVNQSSEQALAEDTRQRIADSCDHFLNLPIYGTTTVPVDRCVRQAERANRPTQLQAPDGPLSQAMDQFTIELVSAGRRWSSALALVTPSGQTPDYTVNTVRH